MTSSVFKKAIMRALTILQRSIALRVHSPLSPYQVQILTLNTLLYKQEFLKKKQRQFCCQFIGPALSGCSCLTPK